MHLSNLCTEILEVSSSSETAVCNLGITIGNAFRRVLLSSLPGSCISGVKIDGITHEYSTIKGVKDSVLDITLNL
ncbi:hypothetical protein RSW31_24420, partial [Escherichia coli]|nr:hypothetical protein [Escherichia coli]